MSSPTKSHGRKSISASVQPRDLMATAPKLANVWTAQIITLFPESFPGVLEHSLTGRALDEEKWALETIDLRSFGDGKHKNVDDTPSGGGAGMVLRADVVGKAVQSALGKVKTTDKPLICLSPRGRPFDQAMARSWSEGTGIILLCGRFEGIDQRVLDHYGIEEVSLGDFVMTGGEIAAQAMIDATVRLLPGVLGNNASIEEESHSDGLLEHPQFTRPAEWQGKQVPEILQSGNHQKISEWRKAQSQELTRERRPDLWAKKETP
jgi:tRNA (guanine37-N1)-methyltransferase